ncbi:hypothetical protein K8B33_00285 [Alcanivorax sp. JB21]|uniref:hypothetical protein n=1 Tax=Alcanivorax limicola TaxID=2874102 RepID=UPI001CBFC705|nr:hypothetical protein [Alcanivorax limicola]MBZ2187521.1 hypothetical protein [Alcanivorax limicola]
MPALVVSCLGVVVLAACGGGGSSGSPGPANDVVTLQSLQSASGSVPEGEWRHARIEVPAGYARLKVVANRSGSSGSTRMIMLKTMKGSDALLNGPMVECDTVMDGANITCEVENPSAGTWFISHKGLETTSLSMTVYYDNPVSLAAYGGSTYAAVNQGDAGYINNGSTTGNYWSGSAVGQWLGVALDQDYQITEVVVHSNAGASIPRPFSLLDASVEEAGNDQFYYLFRHNEVSTYCASAVFSSDRHWCRVARERRPAGDISIELQNGASVSAGDVRVYEIEVHGFTPTP